MKTQINKVVSICYYYIRRLRQLLQHCLSQSTLTMLITSLILQRLVGLSVLARRASSIRPLQRVQNAAARLVLNLDHRELSRATAATLATTALQNTVIIIIISTTMFMVLSSWQSHCESCSPGSFDECRMAPSGSRPKTKPDDLGCESACTGCQKLHPPSPFIITQPES